MLPVIAVSRVHVAVAVEQVIDVDVDKRFFDNGLLDEGVDASGLVVVVDGILAQFLAFWEN